MDPVTQTHLSSLLNISIFFFLLLSTALVGTEGNSSSFIGHTLTRERKIQAIQLLWCPHIYVLPSYSHPIPTPFSSCSSLGPYSTIQQLIWKPHGYHEITNRYPSLWPNYHTVCMQVCPASRWDQISNILLQLGQSTFVWRKRIRKRNNKAFL